MLTRNALRLTCLSVLAMSAVAAPAAQASNFTATSYPAIVTGVNEGASNYFEVGGFKTECKKALFSGTLTAASASLTLTPTYEECTTSLGTAASVHLNGCTYLDTAGSGAVHTWNGSVHLQCPAGKDVTITTGLCTIHIPPQTFQKTLTYTNATFPIFFKLDESTTTKVTMTNVFLCPKTGELEMTSVSTKTFTGFKDSAGKEGEQVGVTVD